MQTRNIWYFALILLLGLNACASKYLPLEAEQVKSDWISTPLNLEFEAKNMYPARGIVNLSSYYSLKLKGDTASFHLPYFGRAYQLDFSDEGYTIENALITSLTYQTKKETESILMNIEVKKAGKSFSFILEFWEDGTAYLHVTSISRNKISYDGFLIRHKD